MTDYIPFAEFMATAARLGEKDAGVALLQTRGGTRVYFPHPRRINSDHWLARRIGVRAATVFCQEFNTGRGGMELCLPTIVPRASANVRRIAVRDLSIAGESTQRIALSVGITTRAVRRIRAKLRASGELPPKPKERK